MTGWGRSGRRLFGRRRGSVRCGVGVDQAAVGVVRGAVMERSGSEIYDRQVVRSLPTSELFKLVREGLGSEEERVLARLALDAIWERLDALAWRLAN